MQLRIHTLDDPDKPVTLAVYKPGTILNADFLDGGKSKAADAFPICRSESVHCLLLSEAAMSQIWAATLKVDKQMRLSVFEGFPLFKNLSEQTKYKILYEYGKIKVCQPGHVI